MIYTDKLPKNCINCPCQDGEYGQCNITLDECNADKRPSTCPLVLIERWRLESCQTCGVKESPYPWECAVYDEEVRWDKKAKTHTCDRWKPI